MGSPHLTLAYDPALLPEQSVESVEWTVAEFVLIRSLVGQNRHLTLGRWPF